jgi:hypothetical protein
MNFLDNFSSTTDTAHPDSGEREPVFRYLEQPVSANSKPGFTENPKGTAHKSHRAWIFSAAWLGFSLFFGPGRANLISSLRPQLQPGLR